MAKTEASLAYQAYDLVDIPRNELLLNLIRDENLGRYTKTSKCDWESTIVLSLKDIEEKLRTSFCVKHSDDYAAHASSQLSYIITPRDPSGQIYSYVIDVTIREDLADYIIFSRNLLSLQRAEEDLLNNFKLYQPSATSDKKCSFRFHHKGCDGVETRIQALDAVSLLDIRDNYTPEVFSQVEKLSELVDPYKSGKIILYHGPAGSGKTHLIRALAYEWSKKFDIQPEVVIDPEPLFEQPGYLMELLTERNVLNKTPKFRFIIAEDCANLFGAKCRDNAGFTRLLNVVDGLLGAGQKLVFLFTANEEIHEIDPAILRPGRCLQHLHIPDWNRESSAAWLTRRGSAAKIDKLSATNSLADLYAIHNGTDIFTNKKETFGFNGVDDGH